MKDRHSMRFLALLLAVAFLAPGGIEARESVPGVDLSPLNDEQHAEAMKIFAENSCNCGCGMTVLRCRSDDPNCTRSPALAKQVVQLLGQGKPSAEVVKTVFAAPRPAPAPAQPAGGGAKEMVFDIPAGDSYAVGSESAPVTLVTWLDYQ